MDFVSLSKILPILIYPFTLMLWLMLSAMALLYFRKVRCAAACIVVAIAVLVVCGNPSLSFALHARHERAYLPGPLQDYPNVDAIIVLGGALSPPLPPRTSTDLSGAADRILHGVRLYRAGKAATIVLSGGNVFPQPGFEAESFYTAQLMEEWGVPRSAIVIERRSRNTYENAVYSKAIMREKGFEKVLLVTSALHMPRALAVFRSAGIDAIAAPTDYNIVKRNQPWILEWFPTLSAMDALTDVFREHLGILVYRYRGWISSAVWSRET